MSDYEKEHREAKQKVKEFNEEVSKGGADGSVNKERLIDQFVIDKEMKSELKNDLTMKEKADLVRLNQQRIQQIEKTVKKTRIAQGKPESQQLNENGEYASDETGQGEFGGQQDLNPTLAQAKAVGSLYTLPIDCVEVKLMDLFERFPEKKAELISLVSNHKYFKDAEFPDIKQHLERDKLLQKHTKVIKNRTFDEQKQLRKILVESADGEQSEYESELDELSALEDAAEIRLEARKQSLQTQSHRIFKYLTV